MEKKRRGQPDEWVEDGWDTFDTSAKEWYTRFANAFYWGDYKALQQLCDEAPSDQFERFKEEIRYELDSWSRRQYTVPKSRKPNLSEWDYAWAPSIKKSNKRAEIDEAYNGLKVTSGTSWWRTNEK